ncbi:SDR family oxidoreductase [Rhodocytophaga rosea]|uniref:SDR family oxidoreductase n=1 Tax=Rhodocytophaga rosea TaxID=2704465 RepID=A0A6C0GP65_9BACT|nr:SDR family NAD(P)-dependent oxidoreductase [Rhodocytophaga rosea]QHT69410.1 SDR family oxidoreductase [Rhodocytophaga rosea]
MENNSKELEGKVAFITGAGSGIGKAAALLFARQGASIAALGHTEDELRETVDQVKENGGEAILLLGDISQAADMENAIGEAVQKLGRLDIVFANAGINGVWAPIEELAPEEWDKTININLRGTFLTVKYAIPHLKKQGGSIIITSSVNGTRIFSNTGATAYSCTKAAQVAFTQMAALELAKHRIRVNVICPGAIETSIDDNTNKRDLASEKEPVEFPEGKIPLTDGKPGKSEQVAQLALFLASDRSSHITGTPIWIDGAESLLMG